MKISVVGLGKIGLPLAVQFASSGNLVSGIDINANLVDAINERNISSFQEEGLEERLEKVLSSGNLTATTNLASSVNESDVVIVVIPVIVDEKGYPLLENFLSTCVEIAKNLKENALVSIETTLPVGTTRNKIFPVMKKNLLPNVSSFHLVFSPERVLSGRIFADLMRYPKILGGVEECCAKFAYDFYSNVLEFENRIFGDRQNGVWLVENSDTAEFVKIMETTYRDVNIGLANEFARFADSKGINIFESIQAANSQDFSHIHEPGIAVGGHCIPVYSQFYLNSNPQAMIVQSGRESNEYSPKYHLELLASRIGNFSNKRVLILGISYRSGVKEDAFSGAHQLKFLLKEYGAIVLAQDILYSFEEISNLNYVPFDGNLANVDAIVVQSFDKSYLSLLKEFSDQDKLILDGRNSLAKTDINKKNIISPGNLAAK
jgi:nucleotide sugar dehydrogenase